MPVATRTGQVAPSSRDTSRRTVRPVAAPTARQVNATWLDATPPRFKVSRCRAELVSVLEARGVPPYKPMLTRCPLLAGSFAQAREAGSPESTSGDVTSSCTQLVSETHRPARLRSW